MERTASASEQVANASSLQGPHSLSLKVMRISAPTLATSDRPYHENYDHPIPTSATLQLIQQTLSQHVQDEMSRYTSSYPSTSGRELLETFTSSLTQAQSVDVLSNQPTPPSTSDLLKGTGTTLIDWPISSMLVLPNSFGTIFLGETFRAYLGVRNESTSSVCEPSLRIEMQTGDGGESAGRASGSRTQLANITLEPPTNAQLASHDKLEATVKHEIKELGPHVLICTVSYKARQEGEVEWVERSFRKFYKFDVPASPISVRTKTHAVKSPMALLHPDHRVREKVLFEVQVQNVCGAPLVFEGLELRPVAGWKWESIDRPHLKEKHMWAGLQEPLLPDDVRQYLFSLTPTSETPSRPLPPLLAMVVQAPASTPDRRLLNPARQPPSIGPAATVNDPIGNLDISWRMSLGEPGRLQTSQLARKRIIVPPTRCLETGPLLEAELNLTTASIEALSHAQSDEELPLSFDLWIRDLSLQAEVDEDSDDDRPLSEIASPRNAVKELSNQPKRRFRLGVQHLGMPKESTVEPPEAPQAAGYTVRQSIDSIRSETGSLFRSLTLSGSSTPRPERKPKAVPPTPPPKSPPPPASNTIPRPFFDVLPPITPDTDVLLLGTTLLTFEASETASFQFTFLPMQAGFKRIGGIRLLVIGWESEGDTVNLKQSIIVREWPVVAEAWVR